MKRTFVCLLVLCSCLCFDKTTLYPGSPIEQASLAKLPVVHRKYVKTNPEYFIRVYDRRDTGSKFSHIKVSKKLYDSLKLGYYYNR